jgi:hypothetical protein
MDTAGCGKRTVNPACCVGRRNAAVNWNLLVGFAMSRSRSLPWLAAFPLAALVNTLCVRAANAHVKWFCAYDVAGTPRGLENVLCPDFEVLFGLTLLALLAGALGEATYIGDAMLRSLDRVTSVVRDQTEIIFRVGTAFFFISIWSLGGVLLTPELKTSSALVGAIQLGIAAGMLSRRTMPLSAIGIFVLFGIGVWNYGIFHLADYPVFLGVAGYLALTGLQKDLFGVRAIDVVRYTAGVTLMWASIEKWAYPEWSFPLFVSHPEMTLGFSAEFFMRSAGSVEFALAFALMWTPLVRRLGALMLTAMFISAVFEFGKIDLIGHTLIVVVLVAIVADNGGKRIRSLRPSWSMPFAYAASLALFLALYYVGHAALFGTPIT